jgi:midasin
MWLVHFYNYFNSHITQLNLPALIKLIPKSMTSKSEIFFHQIHLLIEQLLYRFVYYHYCTSAMYLSLSKTFLNLLRDGFQMPSDEEKKNNEQQKSEGGPSGMGEGEIEKDAKDVSDQIETEDQLDEAKMPGQEENTDEQQNVDEEASGIEVSFDFEAPMEDPTQG